MRFICILCLLVHGIGPSTAQKFYSLGYRTLDQLRTYPHLTSQQTLFLSHYDELTSKICRQEIAFIQDQVTQVLHSLCPVTILCCHAVLVFAS